MVALFLTILLQPDSILEVKVNKGDKFKLTSKIESGGQMGKTKYDMASTLAVEDVTSDGAVRFHHSVDKVNMDNRNPVKKYIESSSFAFTMSKRGEVKQFEVQDSMGSFGGMGMGMTPTHDLCLEFLYFFPTTSVGSGTTWKIPVDGSSIFGSGPLGGLGPSDPSYDIEMKCLGTEKVKDVEYFKLVGTSHTSSTLSNAGQTMTTETTTTTTYWIDPATGLAAHVKVHSDSVRIMGKNRIKSGTDIDTVLVKA